MGFGTLMLDIAFARSKRVLHLQKKKDLKTLIFVSLLRIIEIIRVTKNQSVFYNNMYLSTFINSSFYKILRKAELVTR